MIYILLKNQQR